ncbi:hypothetical protein A0H81_07365 [Grifola frondosa]|uniref:Uncharacterized protein n=1 Tax=Grifola frondosa TaxID=5627 RepID=A0A1C7M600_GRIFR|nr:hypothetical protein A0H81_07365 [Grifola frondosa]
MAGQCNDVVGIDRDVDDHIKLFSLCSVWYCMSLWDRKAVPSAPMKLPPLTDTRRGGTVTAGCGAVIARAIPGQEKGGTLKPI